MRCWHEEGCRCRAFTGGALVCIWRLPSSIRNVVVVCVGSCCCRAVEVAEKMSCIRCCNCYRWLMLYFVLYLSTLHCQWSTCSESPWRTVCTVLRQHKTENGS